MSKTVDELCDVFGQASGAEYERWLYDKRSDHVALAAGPALAMRRAGIAAVIRALRDDMTKLGALEFQDSWAVLKKFDEILGDAGEKVAGGSTREDEQSCNSSDGSSPATDFAAHLARQRAFSERTFGPGERVEGVSDHIRKELVEVAGSEPGHDRQREWIDVVMLALDGAWRSGMSPEEIIAGLRFKLDINERRSWPDWRTADPNKAIEHHPNDRAPATDPAPAVCVWREISVLDGIDHYSTKHGVKNRLHLYRKDDVCPVCLAPIKFTEAKT